MSPPATAFEPAISPLVPGPVLIEASAGTGKTYTLTAIALRMLLDGTVGRIGGLLVVTYTIAATAELTGRLRSRLREALHYAEHGSCDDPLIAELVDRDDAAQLDRLRQAVLDSDQLAVHTIHGFCHRVLEAAALPCGTPFRLGFITSDAELVAACAEHQWRRLVLQGPRWLAAGAATLGLQPKDFELDRSAIGRHPGCRWEPPPPPLEAVAETLRQAAQTALRSCPGPDLAAHLASLRFNTGSLVPGHELEVAAQLAGVLDDDPRGMWWLQHIVESVRKDHRREAAKDRAKCPFVIACQDFADALQTLKHPLRAALCAALEDDLTARKATAGLLGFDDLLERVHHALGDPVTAAALQAAIASRWQAALIDEFQDTDRRQWEIFARCFADRPLVVVGDPKQAIYAFRGADLRTYLQARDGARLRYRLGRNFRSAPAILAAIQRLFAVERPFVDPGIDFEPVAAARSARELAIEGDPGPAVRWLPIPAPSDGRNRFLSKDQGGALAIGGCADELLRLLSSQLQLVRVGDAGAEDLVPLRPGHCAVLVRSHHQAEAMLRALRDRGIPAVLGRAGDIFKTAEADELERLLRAVAEPRLATLASAMATTAWGATATAIRDCLDDPQALASALEALHGWRRSWLRHGLMAAVDALLDAQAMRHRLLAQSAGERRLTNLLHLLELTHASLGSRAAPEAVLAWLARERNRSHAGDEATELRLETDAEAVRVVTMHAAKGLEYEVVCCPCLWDVKPITAGPVHRFDDAGAAVYDCEPADTALAAADRERLAEDLRLVYVALTRAKRRLIIAWGPIGQQVGCSALAWLLHRGNDDLASWEQQLRAHIAADPDSGICEPPAAGARYRQQLAVEPGPPRLAPEGLPARLETWRVTSFSSLSRGASHEGPDHADPAEPPIAPVDLRGIHAFARGTAAGTCLHAILEELDPTAVESTATRQLIASQLDAHGLADPRRHDGPVEPVRDLQRCLAELCTRPIPAWDFSLAAQHGPRRCELRFFLPLRQVSAAAIAEVFLQHGDARLQAYAPALARLGSERVRGFLTGFIDLVCAHDGRWYVIDWKSNHLGADGSAYTAPALWRAMVEHHYVLQAQLYLLALHRQLQARLPDYDPVRQLGGAGYAFLRACDGSGAQPWCVLDAEPGLIAALDRLLVATP